MVCGDRGFLISLSFLFRISTKTMISLRNIIKIYNFTTIRKYYIMKYANVTFSDFGLEIANKEKVDIFPDYEGLCHRLN